MSKTVTHLAHFTTLKALKSMFDFNGKNHALHFRATIYNQMNDGNEGLILRNKYFTHFKKKTKGNKNLMSGLKLTVNRLLFLLLKRIWAILQKEFQRM